MHLSRAGEKKMEVFLPKGVSRGVWLLGQTAKMNCKIYCTMNKNISPPVTGKLSITHTHFFKCVAQIKVFVLCSKADYKKAKILTVPIENHQTPLKQLNVIQPEIKTNSKKNIYIYFYLQILPYNIKLMKEKATVLKMSKKLKNENNRVGKVPWFNTP